MPRPKSRRMIGTPPLFDSFKPAGTPARDLTDLTMSLDELEALRLADYEGLTQDDAALQMDISRSTFSRLIESAHHKSAEFLLQGRRLLVGGGPVHFRGNLRRCGNCGKVMTADFQGGPTVCDSCGSDNLTDLAGRYGHGECCSETISVPPQGRRRRSRRH